MSSSPDPGASRAQARQAQRAQRGRTSAVVLLTLGFLLGVIVLAPGEGPVDGVRRVLGVTPERPLPVVEPPTRSGAYAFMQTTAEGEPIGFDPCTPVTVRINPDRAPRGSERLVESAASQLSQASGVALELGEETDARPLLGQVGELQRQQSAAPPAEPEIVVLWSRPRETPTLSRRTVGVGGSTAYAIGEARPYFRQGAVALDTGPLREALLRGDGARRVTAVIMHELAHALGLDHVAADGELMNARSLGRLELGPGDRTGLALLGAVPCA
ncbi:hypothetical protein KLP28_15430 [Nocardioidaceae bacterium]|nr:hypothetical protein KLP28_15430 [Nocardioidaceae bacterium]